MKQRVTFRHEFVESFPDALEPGVLYISLPYATATHRCACGCGNEVVTPLSPTDWQLYFDGVSVSLTPSIGNWDFPCRSHYFIRHNAVLWARSWSLAEVKAGREQDRRRKENYFSETAPTGRTDNGTKPKKSRWQQFKNRFDKNSRKNT